MVSIRYVLARSCDVFIHFCFSEHWHFGQRSTPSVVRICNRTDICETIRNIFEFKLAHKLLTKMARQIAVKCIENNLAPRDGSMLDADGVHLRCCFLLVYNPLGSGSTILLSLPDRMYSSTLTKE